MSADARSQGGGEFYYRLRDAVGGYRPGGHRASSAGAGDRFAGHARLFDVPDPRRLDLRASLREGRREWLVRVHRQRAALAVFGLVDVSASMAFGSPQSKLERAADLVESMGQSAFRSGDPAGLITFASAQPSGAPPSAARPNAARPSAARPNTVVPARHRLGVGKSLRSQLLPAAPTESRAPGSPRDAPMCDAGLQSAALHIAGQDALVFLLSDFHWPLEWLTAAFDALPRARVIPVVIWDQAEIEAPAASGLLDLRDAETGRFRSLWMDHKLRVRWHSRIAERRHVINAICNARDVRAFYLLESFDPAALTQYFMDEFV